MKRRAAALALLCLVLVLPGCAQAKEDAAAYESGAGYAAGLLTGQDPEQPPAPPEEDSPALPELDDSGFVEVAQAAPDVLLEIRYYSTYNFVGERIDGYEAPTALLTREAAQALRAVSDSLLEQGYRLKIFDAYRPQQAVDHFKAWAENLEDIRMKPYFYPDVEKSQLFRLGYIASRSGHSRGSTVDLTLVDMATGQEADMGGSFDYFGSRSNAGYTDGLTETQLQNRRLLREAMTAGGFRGISTEWWHFTLAEEPYPDTYFSFPVKMLES